MEEYSVSKHAWKNLNIKAPVSMPQNWKTSSQAVFCEYWDGLIYAVFKLSSDFKNWNPRFHVYDTKAKQWRTLDTGLKTRSMDSMSAITPAV